ncbi:MULTISPECIES: hypothetical protein [unclassified Methanoculleus]|uniref:Uncharacterized protein n=1 Tax=Methanoculleus palmolei TaxID=72612 RepID=A0ABD8A8F3_9EURY|nr:hypothetical protein [Methanoculleus sp. UBA377]MDD2472936.1 hypothetical protein [Methanoculleus sp.]WOX55395.1 hypothetical protein R6Y95_07965 [Methanoculleus palmolei]
MSRKKEVTIGITVNLDNYENLRLEVKGDVEAHEDVDDLITFLDGMLARFGRGDAATAERVNAYRRRVLAARPAEPQASAATRAAPEEMPATTAAEPTHRTEEDVCPSTDVIAAAIPPAPEHPEPPRIPEPPAKQEEKNPEPARPVQTPQQQEPAIAKPAAAPGEDVCEICGAAVSKSQAKLSQLFMGKTLCKKCMEQP